MYDGMTTEVEYLRANRPGGSRHGSMTEVEYLRAKLVNAYLLAEAEYSVCYGMNSNTIATLSDGDYQNYCIASQTSAMRY